MRYRVTALLVIPCCLLSLGCHELAGLADLEISTLTASGSGAGGQGTTSSGGAGGTGGAGGSAQCVGTAENSLSFAIAKQLGDDADQHSPRIAAVSAAGYWLVGNNGGLIGKNGVIFEGVQALDDDDLFVLKLGPSWQGQSGSNIATAGLGLQPLITMSDSSEPFMAASFTETITLASQPITSGGKLDFFVSGFDNKTALANPKEFGAGQADVVAALATDASGNRFLAGYYKNALNFECTDGQLYSAGDENFDAFVAKLDNQNKCLWSRSFGPPISGAANGNRIALALTVGSDGDPVVAGTYSGLLQLGDKTHSATGYDIFVAKLDGGTGAAIWSKTFAAGEGGSGVARALAVTGNADIIMVGDFSGDFNFGAGVVSAAHTVPEAVGAGKAFVLKLNKEGAIQWSRVFEGNGSQVARSVVVDSEGIITVVGDFTGCIDLGDGGFESAGGSYDLPGENLFVVGGGGDIFVTQLEFSGNLLAGGTFGDGETQIARQVIAPTKQAVFVVGDFKGTLDLGTNDDALESTAGTLDIFIAAMAAPD